MSKDVLIFAEQREGRLHGSAAQLMTAAGPLAAESGGGIVAAVIGHDVGAVAEQVGRLGVQRVYAVEDERLRYYTVLRYARALQQVIERVQPGAVLMAHTFMGRDLAPRLAARLGAATAPDCTEISISEGHVHIRRPVYNGKATCEVRLAPDRLRIISVRPNVFAPAEAKAESAPVERVGFEPGPGDDRLETLEVVRTAGGVKDVAEADIIVSGGRSLKSEENFRMLYELAELLDGAVGASRAAVDAGYQPHSRQVGLTGKTVTPKLYMAFGIDGAIQHLAGMRGSKVIVAVNTKPEAPIFQVATYGCVADLFEMVPALIREIRRLKEAG